MNTYAEIDLAAVNRNISEIRKIIPGQTRFMAVVKANAYGHGSVAVSRKAQESGVEYLAVANIREAIELRDNGILGPILILTESPTSVLDDVIQYNFTQTVYSYTEAKALSDEAARRGRTARMHIKIDTGMGRVGILPPDALAEITKISSLPNLEIEGIFTHFAKADYPDQGESFTSEQFNKFKNIISRLPNIRIKHAANSAATLFFPTTHLDMVRIGLMMYGMYPNEASRQKIKLSPALSFKTRVTYLKRVPAGTALGYGGEYTTRQETHIATLPVGYADGFSRRLSNRGSVLIRGRRFPVVGRISMDLSLVDVGSSHVETGDEVVLIGQQGFEVITADEVARLEDTINYEVVCSIGKRVPRVYK
ncbi:MAG: alanine racemase [Candidatus Margulisiibacteriota bacterium]|nr:alanine racemase [Candidatus Margulisiibacteriota bacterium]